MCFPSAFSLASLQGSGTAISDVVDFANDVTAAGTTSFKFDRSSFSQMRVIGQFNLGFIIAALRMSGGEAAADGQAEGPSDFHIFIVDQHASDEKFRFEGLNRDSKIDRQPLVALHPLQLTPAQESIAEAHLDVFRLNGFELKRDDTRPPGRRLRVATLPTWQGLVFSESDIHDLIDTLESTEAMRGSAPRAFEREAPRSRPGLLDLFGHRASFGVGALPRPQKVWKMLACRACRGAIMIGKGLRANEMEKILMNLGTLQQPWNCPHGRPTMRHLVDTCAARKAPCERPPLSHLLAAGA